MKLMKSKRVALWGIMGALAIVVSFLEGLFDIPFLPPGTKPGLSNVITVAAAMISGLGGAAYITAVKSLFALLTRGTTAFLLSFSGGMLSTLGTVMLLKRKKCPFSLLGISVIGALLHNAGQLAVAAMISGTSALIYYAPVLLIFSLIAGALTGFVLTAIKPFMQKISQIYIK